MPTIVEAIASGQLDALRTALVEDARHLNTAADNGEYPIHAAVKSKSFKMVELLIEAGANINQGSEETGSMRGYTAAHYAARNGDVDSILLLAKHKADFRREAADHWQPIHCAAFGGKRLAMLALLDNGADIHAKNQHGHTALVYAVNHGRTADVRELLARGASLEINDPNGDSLLHQCFHYQMSKLFEGEYEIPEVQLDVAVVLANVGCPIESKNNDGNTADYYLKEDIPSFTNVLKILSCNAEKMKSSKTDWNYMTLLAAKVEHFLGIGLDMKHAMDLYENMKKSDQERKDAKKRREEERPAGGCPVMRGKKKKPADGAASSDAAASGHPPNGHPDIDVRNVDPNGPDPSGGQCPFFKKKPAAAAPATAAPVAAPQDSVAPVAAPAPSKPVSEPVDAYVAALADKRVAPVQAVAKTPNPMSWEFIFENRTAVLLMLIAFFLGMIVEQWMNRLFGVIRR